MSRPISKIEMHERVEDYCNNFIGEPIEILYLKEEINHPEKRTDRFAQFLEYLQN